MGIGWLDILLVVVFVSAVIAEVRRGFGRAVFDLVGVVLALLLARAYYGSLTLSPFGSGDMNQVFRFSALLVPALVLCLILADLAYNSLLVSMDIFERLFGGICGVGVGIALAHSLAFGIWLGTGRDADRAEVFSGSAVAGQVLTFDAYHHGMDWLASLGQEKSENPPM